MAGPIRSAVLGAGSLPVGTGQRTVLTVPAGITYILKDCLVMNTNATAQLCLVQVQRAGVQPMAVVIQSLTQNQTVHVLAGTVLVAGDQLVVACSLGGMNYWLSGTRLTGVAEVP